MNQQWYLVVIDKHVWSYQKNRIGVRVKIDLGFFSEVMPLFTLAGSGVIDFLWTYSYIFK
jgi:hypothetical protein